MALALLADQTRLRDQLTNHRALDVTYQARATAALAEARRHNLSRTDLTT